MSTRLSININDETAAALQELAKKRGVSVTEIVRRAVSVYKFVEDEVSDGDKTLQLVDNQDRVTQLAIL
jgi:predicted transcriptional regulator